MELVYLWVDNYKNIKNQGFNFSPNFDCSYDNGKLTVKNKENPLDGFFGKNINITAIVGENGSGKSKLLECLLSVLINNEEVYKYFLICYKNNKDLILYKSTSFVNKICNEIKEIYVNENIIEKNRDVYSLYITNEYLEETFFEKIHFKTKRSDAIRTHREKKTMYRKILNNAKKNTDIKFIQDSKEFFIPTKIKIKSKSFLKDIKKLNRKDQVNIENLNRQAENSLKEFKYKEYFRYIYEIKEVFKNSDYFPNSYIGRVIDEEYIYGYNEDLSNRYEIFLDNLNKQSFSDSIFYEFFVEDISDETINFIDSISNISFFEIDLISDTKSFNDLSYGEQQLLTQLHLILDKLLSKRINSFDHSTVNEDITIKKYFIFIDEFELGLHPNWQKKALSYIIDFFKLLDIKIDLFITSHSPFLLSDLPKENIIFLEKEKETGNCKNVTKDMTLKPFGANIHTLLSDGFFMKDGLMGEFAKGKIDDLINYLNDKESDIENNDEAQKLLNIIGEPVIKNQLQRMLDSKRLSKIDEIDKLSDEIELMKHRIEFLRKDK